MAFRSDQRYGNVDSDMACPRHHTNTCTKTVIKNHTNDTNREMLRTPRNKRQFDKHSHRSRSQSPSSNVQCIPQIINGVRCMSFTSSGEKKRKTSVTDRLPKNSKRRLKFFNEPNKETQEPRNTSKKTTTDEGVIKLDLQISYSPITESAFQRAERIAKALTWDVVEILRESTDENGRDIVLVKARGAPWAPNVSALRARDGTITVLSDSNKRALLHIEDSVNVAIRNVQTYRVVPGNVAQEKLSESEKLACSVLNRYTTEGEAYPKMEIGDIDFNHSTPNKCNRNSCNKTNKDSLNQRSTKLQTTTGNRDTVRIKDGKEIPGAHDSKLIFEREFVPTRAVDRLKSNKNKQSNKVRIQNRELNTAGKDEGIRLIDSAINLLEDIDVDIESNQSLPFHEAGNVIDEAIKDLQNDRQLRSETNLECVIGDMTIQHLSLDKSLQKLRRDIERIKSRYRHHQSNIENGSPTKSRDSSEGESIINSSQAIECAMETNTHNTDEKLSLRSGSSEEEYTSEEYVEGDYPELPETEQEFVEHLLLREKSSSFTKYDQIIYNLIDGVPK